MADPIKVLIVDDYAVVRHGLRALIGTAADMVVVGEAADGETAVAQVRALQPDVIVMDLMLPGQDGIAAITAIQQIRPHGRILVLTNLGSEQQVMAAMKAGARGYLLKDAVLTNVVKAIRRVHAGQVALHPTVNRLLSPANLPLESRLS